MEGTAVQLQFEMLLTDISARFLGMIPRDVDVEIGVARGKIREFYNSHMCGFFRVNQELTTNDRQRQEVYV